MSLVEQNLQLDKQAIAELCRRHHIVKLSLFGSALRDDFGKDSDVDVLAEFDDRYPIGFRIFDIEDDLSRQFGGRKVDVLDLHYLNEHIADEVLNSAYPIYEAGDESSKQLNSV